MDSVPKPAAAKDVSVEWCRSRPSSQRRAHSYFPTFLYRDDTKFDLPGNDGKGVGNTYAQNLIADETLAWVTANKDKPFFLFYSITLPHARHEIDSQGVYKNEKWTEQQKSYAAQVTRLDSDVNRLLAKLKELKLDEKTLVIVAGDNGSSFAPNSEMRGLAGLPSRSGRKLMLSSPAVSGNFAPTTSANVANRSVKQISRSLREPGLT